MKTFFYSIFVLAASVACPTTSVASQLSAAPQVQADKMPTFAGLASIRKEERKHKGTNLRNDPAFVHILTYISWVDKKDNMASLFKGIDIFKSGKPVEKEKHYREWQNEGLLRFIVQEDKDFYLVTLDNGSDRVRIQGLVDLINGKDFMFNSKFTSREVHLPLLHERVRKLSTGSK